MIDDFGLLRFVPLAIEDKHAVRALLRHIDKANGYAFTGRPDTEGGWPSDLPAVAATPGQPSYAPSGVLTPGRLPFDLSPVAAIPGRLPDRISIVSLLVSFQTGLCVPQAFARLTQTQR